MLAVCLGGPSPLATQIGVGRRVRCQTRDARTSRWTSGVRTTSGPRAPQIFHRDRFAPVTHVIYGDTLRAGIEGRTEVWGLFIFSSAGGQGEWAVPYQGAQTLDAECFSSEPDVEAIPILRRLRLYPKVLGQCVCAFTECSSDIHLLLRETARGPRPCATGAKFEVGAVSVEAAVATYSARHRRHWEAELALQGARLRFSRAYLAFQAPSCHAEAGMIIMRPLGPLLSALTRPTAHNMLRKRHPSLEARRVARIGTSLSYLFAVLAALCIYLSGFLGSLQYFLTYT